MTKFPRAFLFDCDGTLFDTERLKAQSWGRAIARLLQSHRVAHQMDIENRITAMYQAGGTTEEVANDILRQCKEAFPGTMDFLSSEQLIREREKAKNEIFDEAFPTRRSNVKSDRNLVIEPVWKLAVDAKGKGYPVALVTTTELNWVQRYFAASNITGVQNEPIRSPEEFFHVVVCGKKKGAGIKEAICKILGKVDFSEIPVEELIDFVIVEDSPEGTQEARSVGIRVITVPNDFTKAAFPHLLLSQKQLEKMSLDKLVQATMKGDD